MAQHKKVKQWFLNPTKFCRDIESEQKRHPGKCIYHLSKSHSTAECSVKKECEKLIAEKKDGATSTLSPIASGHLRNAK